MLATLKEKMTDRKVFVERVIDKLGEKYEGNMKLLEELFPKINFSKNEDFEQKKRKQLQKQKILMNKMKKQQNQFSKKNQAEDSNEDMDEENEISCCLCKSDEEASTLGYISLLTKSFSPNKLTPSDESLDFPLICQDSPQIHSCTHVIQ
jgi:hypothetical protein